MDYFIKNERKFIASFIKCAETKKNRTPEGEQGKKD
jgi:hypothetical protein